MTKLLITTAAILATVASAHAETTCRVSKAQYDQIQTGQKLADVESSLGCAGEEIAQTAVGRMKFTMLQWTGAQGISLLHITFKDGTVTTKAQFGLK